MRVPYSRALVPALLAALAPTAAADDWPQWMGPNRDGVWKETGVLDKFPEGGPKKLWSAPVHGGYAGPAVAAGKVYVTDWLPDAGTKPPSNPFDVKPYPGKERVLCLDEKTGKEVWKHEYPVGYQLSYASGPRCTPTVSGGKVYALGAMGDLFCLDADKGAVVWKKDFKADYQAKTPLWGFCGHPLVYQNLLICLVGGPDALVVAFDKDTGKEVWKALSPAKPDQPGYSPPSVLKVGGADVVAQFHPTGVSGLEPKTGKVLWTVPVKHEKFGMTIMGPQQSGDKVLAADNEAAVAFKIDAGAKPADLWRGDMKQKVGLNPVNMTPFIEGDTIYGVDQPGMLRAVDLNTGKRLWYTFEPVIGKEQEEDYKQAGTGTAFLVKNGDRFFVFNELGDLLIAKLSREGYKEIDKAHLVEQTSPPAFGRKVIWTYPAFADKCVFVRNDKEIACFSLAK